MECVACTFNQLIHSHNAVAVTVTATAASPYAYGMKRGRKIHVQFGGFDRWHLRGYLHRRGTWVWDFKAPASIGETFQFRLLRNRAGCRVGRMRNPRCMTRWSDDSHWHKCLRHACNVGVASAVRAIKTHFPAALKLCWCEPSQNELPIHCNRNALSSERPDHGTVAVHGND